MIAVCGMTRSGTTLAWQIACGLTRDSGWEKLEYVNTPFSVARQSQGQNVVLKTYRTVNTEPTNHISDNPDDKLLVCYRDVRDVVASTISKKRILPNGRRPEYAAFLAEINIEMFEFFNAHENKTLLRYEDCYADVPAHVERIAGIIGVPNIPAVADEVSIPRQIERCREALQTSRSVDLIEQFHITNINPHAWKNVLTPDEVDAVMQVSGDWLISNGYEIEV
jgi:hypothetical protein